MEVGWKKPRRPAIWRNRRGFPSGRLNEWWRPISFWMNAPGATDTPEMLPIPKGGSEVCQVGHSNTPILTCGSHGGTPQPTTEPRPKRRALQLTQMASISPTIQTPKGSISTKVSPTSRNTGIGKATHTASWLCWGSCLLKNPGTCGSGPRDACGHYVHRDGIEPRPFGVSAQAG